MMLMKFLIVVLLTVIATVNACGYTVITRIVEVTNTDAYDDYKYYSAKTISNSVAKSIPSSSTITKRIPSSSTAAKSIPSLSTTAKIIPSSSSITKTIPSPTKSYKTIYITSSFVHCRLPTTTFRTKTTTKTIPTTTTTTTTTTTKTVPTTTTTTTTTTKTVPTTTLPTKCIPKTVTVTDREVVTVKETVTVTVEEPVPTQIYERCAGKWAQCGGVGFNGPTCCESGLTCKEISQYYSQCI